LVVALKFVERQEPLDRQNDFIRESAALSPRLGEALAEHLADNDEFLSHVALAALTRTFNDAVKRSFLAGALVGGELGFIRSFASKMEEGFNSGMPELVNLVGASFVENLEFDAAEYVTLKHELGPRTQAACRHYE
jgi:hypothetical protein